MSIIPLYISRTGTKKDSVDMDDEKVHAKVAKIVGNSKGIILSIDGTHSGFVNKNYKKYNSKNFKKVADSFYSPFPKPMLFDHDELTKPSGRVYDAFFVAKPTEVDGQQSDGFIKTGIFIPEINKTKDDIEAIMAGLYITSSISCLPDSINCSVCGTNWLKGRSNKDGEICTHHTGEVYDNQLCYMDYSVKHFTEISIVNSCWKKPEEAGDVIIQGRDFNYGCTG